MALTKILAVDDEPFNLEIIEEILEELDFELQVATSGPECLNMVEGYMPQVILLDVSMPQMNGYEVCKALKANPNTAHIIVMFVSAFILHLSEKYHRKDLTNPCCHGILSL